MNEDLLGRFTEGQQKVKMKCKITQTVGKGNFVASLAGIHTDFNRLGVAVKDYSLGSEQGRRQGMVEKGGGISSQQHPEGERPLKEKLTEKRARPEKSEIQIRKQEEGATPSN